MATGARPVASTESNAIAADQAGLDQKRGNLTRRATLWNQFDALMRAQGPASSDQEEVGKRNDEGKGSENTGNSSKDTVASKNVSEKQKDDNAPKEVRKSGHDTSNAGKRERCISEGSGEKESKTVKVDKLSRRNSASLKAIAVGSKHKERSTVKTTGIGELDDTQEPRGTVGKIKTAALRSGPGGSNAKSTSHKAGDTSAAAEVLKKTDGGHLRQKTSLERTSKGMKEAQNSEALAQKGAGKSSASDGSVKVGSGCVEKNGHSRTPSTNEEVTVKESENDQTRTCGSPHGGSLRVSSRPHSQESGASQRTDSLEEPLAFSRPGSSGSEYNHRSDMNLSESLNRWVTHLTAEQNDSPRTSPRITASVSPLPGDYPSYGKPIMPGYKPMSTKQESLVLPRPARVAEPLHPNPSLRDCIPIMPRSAAIVCFLFNILVPGLGTFFSAFSLMCCGRTRPIGADILSCFLNNCWAALLQLLSTPVLLVGWIWSIIWGLVFLELSAKPPGGEASPLAQSSTTGSRASDLSRIGRTSRASIQSRAVPGRSSTVAPAMASTASQDRPPIITLQEAPVIISHNANSEPHTSQLPQPAANQSNHRYHRMMQRHQRAAAASNNELPFLRAAHMDDFVRLSASVFGIAMVQSEGENAPVTEPGPNQKV